jgi:hypothetical protein
MQFRQSGLCRRRLAALLDCHSGHEGTWNGSYRGAVAQSIGAVRQPEDDAPSALSALVKADQARQQAIRTVELCTGSQRACRNGIV